MKKLFTVLSAAILAFCLTACNKENAVSPEPELSQMKEICELAVMECYYHNVAKYREEDAEKFLFWSKDKHFWIEYSGSAKLGTDASKVTLEVEDNKITITLPEAEVLDYEVDESSLSEDSYIVDKRSADIEAGDEVKAFARAQEDMKETVYADTAMLSNARQRAQELLEDYVTNVGRLTGREYTIEWEYLEDDNVSENSVQEETENLISE